VAYAPQPAVQNVAVITKSAAITKKMEAFVLTIVQAEILMVPVVQVTVHFDPM